MNRYNNNMRNQNHHVNNQGYNVNNQNMRNQNHHINNQGYNSKYQNMNNRNNHINNQGYNSDNQNVSNGNHHINNQGYNSDNQNVNNQNLYVNNQEYKSNNQNVNNQENNNQVNQNTDSDSTNISNLNYNMNKTNYTEDSLNDKSITQKDKNIAIAAGIILVVLILAIIVYIAKDSGDNDGKINENQDMVMATSYESIPSDDEMIQTSIPSEDTSMEENENENIGGSLATIDPQTLPDPEFSQDKPTSNKDQDRREEPADRQEGAKPKEEPAKKEDKELDDSSNVGFQMKKYILETKPNRSVKIVIKGTSRAKVKGKYVYVDKDGKSVEKNWEKKLNKKGEETLNFFVPNKVEKIEFHILSVEVKNNGEKPECIMEKYKVM